MGEGNLKKTPLHPLYSVRPGVKMVDFGGWDMPVQFANGILAEHKAVREKVGLFDVSHMGEITVKGPEALIFLDRLVTNRIAGAGIGQCIYSPMCREDGGTVDDLLVYVMGKDDYLLVVNASNTDKDFDWITGQLKAFGFDARAVNVSAQWAQLALQGPDAVKLLTPFVKDLNPGDVKYYTHAGTVKVAGIDVLLSRTGYTGEDGFELYCAAADAAALWKVLEDAGAEPCGLGARDVLRLEARLPLYGHELKDDISPLEAGIGFFVKLDKEDFNGKKVMAAQKENGIPRRVYGLEMTQAGVAREGYEVFPSGAADGSEALGKVTSGGRSPIRESFIALALLKRGSVKIGDNVEVEIRGKRKSAVIVKTPFYKRG
ncbi:MAG: glycine cleavage system aminomethyltransferase GcvT [Spirochaetaceae bacterium]|nr:glycine cleavage system aminomethyltransferase GcvT [Spirochaetaceae bacterium]RKX78676.1 MAG: glycine cleavage system aminomethyltransferase GcvT [Spirochaetota bacterium]RKX89249.1 MAG: glycine cleavage system aminomethyltransferase GcvT [Spirochaetota bacterium]